LGRLLQHEDVGVQMEDSTSLPFKRLPNNEAIARSVGRGEQPPFTQPLSQRFVGDGERFALGTSAPLNRREHNLGIKE
jgi:hypothetical protein